MRTVLVTNDPQQGPILSNYQLFTYLSTIWKLLSDKLTHKIEFHIDGFMGKAERGIGDGSRKSKHKLLID